MKKSSKQESVSVPEQAEPDIAALINKMQQQLTSLEKKIDGLISRPSERPFEEKRYSKPFQRFDNSNRHGRGGQEGGYRERSFTKAICAECKKECEVPFKPTGDRPVYCKECFSRRKDGGGSPFKREYHNEAPRERDFAPKPHFEKRHSEKKPRFGVKKSAPRRRKVRD